MKVFCYIVCCLCCCVACNDKSGHRPSILPSDIELKCGDLVLRRGFGIMSHAVIAADTGCQYSHIGIVVDSCGYLMIAHAVPGEPDFDGDEDRVKIDKPETFYAEDRAGAGCVLRCKNSKAARKAGEKALSTYKRRMLFDHQFDTRDTSRMYCSEFIEFAYKSAGYPLTSGQRHDINLPGIPLKEIILPSDFIHSERIKRIATF